VPELSEAGVDVDVGALLRPAKQWRERDVAADVDQHVGSAHQGDQVGKRSAAGLLALVEYKRGGIGKAKLFNDLLKVVAGSAVIEGR